MLREISSSNAAREYSLRKKNKSAEIFRSSTEKLRMQLLFPYAG